MATTVNPDLNPIYDRLGTIDGKLDMLLSQDLEKRVGRLERWRSQVLGMGAVVTALVTIALGVLYGGGR